MNLPPYVNVADFLKIGIMAMVFIFLIGKAMEKFGMNSAE